MSVRVACAVLRLECCSLGHIFVYSCLTVSRPISLAEVVSRSPHRKQHRSLSSRIPPPQGSLPPPQIYTADVRLALFWALGHAMVVVIGRACKRVQCGDAGGDASSCSAAIRAAMQVAMWAAMRTATVETAETAETAMTADTRLRFVNATSAALGVAAAASRVRGDGRRAGGGGGRRSGLLLLGGWRRRVGAAAAPSGGGGGGGGGLLARRFAARGGGRGGRGRQCSSHLGSKRLGCLLRLLLVLDAGLGGGAAEPFGEYGDDGGAAHFIFFLRVAAGCTERASQRERWASM